MSKTTGTRLYRLCMGPRALKSKANSLSILVGPIVIAILLPLPLAAQTNVAFETSEAIHAVKVDLYKRGKIDANGRSLYVSRSEKKRAADAMSLLERQHIKMATKIEKTLRNKQNTAELQLALYAYATMRKIPETFEGQQSKAATKAVDVCKRFESYVTLRNDAKKAGVVNKIAIPSNLLSDLTSGLTTVYKYAGKKESAALLTKLGKRLETAETIRKAADTVEQFLLNEVNNPSTKWVSELKHTPESMKSGIKAFSELNSVVRVLEDIVPGTFPKRLVSAMAATGDIVLESVKLGNSINKARAKGVIQRDDGDTQLLLDVGYSEELGVPVRTIFSQDERNKTVGKQVISDSQGKEIQLTEQQLTEVCETASLLATTEGKNADADRIYEIARSVRLETQLTFDRTDVDDDSPNFDTDKKTASEIREIGHQLEEQRLNYNKMENKVAKEWAGARTLDKPLGLAAQVLDIGRGGDGMEHLNLMDLPEDERKKIIEKVINANREFKDNNDGKEMSIAWFASNYGKDIPPPEGPDDGAIPTKADPSEPTDENWLITEIIRNHLANKNKAKNPPTSLQDAEGNLPAMGAIPAGDSVTTSQFVDDSTQQGREDGQAASDLNQLNSDVQQASTSGDGQTAESRNAINDAAVQGQRTLNKAQNTANASDMNNSVGAQLTEEVSSGIKQGFEAAGTALGAALGTKLADQIIKDEKKDERAENRPPAAGGSPSATATSVAAGGGTKTPPKPPPKPTKTRCPICGSYNCNSAGEKRPATQVIYGPIIP